MNNLNRSLIIGYLLLLIFFHIPFNRLSSQTPELLFRYLTTSDGLSVDDVRCIYQDKKGFMWFGTEGGVDRYDGKNFRHFTEFVRDTADNILQSFDEITEDSYSNLWFINDTNGLVLMNQKKETYTRFQFSPNDPKSISSKNLRSVFEDSQKNLWITTFNQGLNLFNRKDSTFIRFLHDTSDASSIGSNTLSAMVEDHKGNVWTASPEGLLIKLDPVTKKFQNIRVTDHSFFFFIDVRINIPALYIDAEDNVWLAHQQDLYKYDQKTKEIKRYALKIGNTVDPFIFITSFIEIERSVFLIATYNAGLFIYDVRSDRLTNYSPNPANPFSISSHRLSCIFRSNEGVIWIGSYNNGINIFSQNYLRFPWLLNLVEFQYLKNANNATYSFCETPDHRILMGTENNGLFIYNPVENSVQRFLPELADFGIFNIYRDDENNLWISTWINGLYCYHWNSGKLKRINSLPASVPPNFLNSLCRIIIDHKNRMWLGSMDKGILLYDRNKNHTAVFQNVQGKVRTLSNNMVYKIFEDSNGNIWVGTASGLNIYDLKKNSFKQLKISDESGNDISGILINDIYEDSQKRLWVGSARALHLYDYSSGTFSTFSREIAGEKIMILEILEDDHNTLWLGTSSGPQSFDIKTGKFKDYGITDGVRYVYNYPNSGVKSSSGYFYLGSQKGVTVFKPEDIRDDTLIPPVYITEIRVNDVILELHGKERIIEEPVVTLTGIKLNYKQSTLYFAFAALNYNNPVANQYAYQLGGYDKDWIYANNNNSAYYANLPPGKYVFKVKASNNHGIWNNTGKEITIHIRQPFWRTFWFKVVLAIFMLSFIPVVYYNRIHNLKRNKKILEGIVKERTKELNEANITLTDQHEELVQQHEEISTQNELLSQMSQEILKQNAELEQHRTNLENLVIERTKELEIAMHKAKESDRLKTAFLANMSHEIRTPMNAIVGFANLLKDTELDVEERNEFIEVINNNSETLLVLIDDILDLSLIEANQLNIRNEIFSVNEMLDNLYSSYSMMNRKPDLVIRLHNEIHDQILQINSDKVRIKQILSNLINNAYKFTEKGFIEIGVKKDNSNLVFYVKDSGIGIEEKEIETVFERFRKSDANNNTLYRGAGLGLAISKALSHLLKGKLYVESALGKGSVFYFVLPGSVISTQEVEMPVPVIHKDTPKWSGKNILIVEDEQANYLYVKKMLSRLDVIVHWAENGLEALKMISSGMQFHLILMDIKMPVMDGYEATKTIKSNNPGQIVIALTAYARAEDKLQFMKAGFDDYLAKPIKPNDFMGVIRKYL